MAFHALRTSDVRRQAPKTPVICRSAEREDTPQWYVHWRDESNAASLKYMFTGQLLFVPLSAFISCVVLHVVALKLFPAAGLMDFPKRYGHKRKPIPYPTGIIPVLFFALVLPAVAGWNKQVIGLEIGMLLLAVVSFVDDRIRVKPTLRLFVHLLTAFIIFGCGTRIYGITNPFVDGGVLKLDTVVIPMALFSNPPLWSGVFTVFWLGLTINALNWFDGIPGQVSILSTIGFLTIGLVSVSSRIPHTDPELQHRLALMAFTLAALSAACAMFDFPPNTVLMGDTGAMFFGLMLGVLTIYAGGKVATAFLVLGVPLIDSVIVVGRRILRGASPLRGNAVDEHLHHRLLAKGWSARKIILLTAALAAAFGVTALFLSTVQKLLAAGLMALIMLALSIYSRPAKKKRRWWHVWKRSASNQRKRL